MERRPERQRVIDREYDHSGHGAQSKPHGRAAPLEKDVSADESHGDRSLVFEHYGRSGQ